MAAVSSSESVDACSSCPNKPSQAPVVLRVKRMRDEDPAEALAIQRKRERLDETRTQAVDDSKEVFRLCGTLSAKSADDHSVLELIKYFKDRRNQVKPNPLAKLSLDDHQKQTRAERKAHTVNRRYKLVSELRSVDKCVSPSPACDKDECLHHIDVETESHASDIEMRVPNVESAKDAPESAITCNSAVMVREKLVPEDKSVYVYDFYYVESQDVSSLDWSTLSAYTQEVEFVHDIIDSSDEELYDDEDDSNDESNWRNDYPDEEEEEEEESSLSEDMDNSYYSYRHKPYNDEFEPYYPEQYCGQLDSDEDY